jgi:hypothetical protein
MCLFLPFTFHIFYLPFPIFLLIYGGKLSNLRAKKKLKKERKTRKREREDANKAQDKFSTYPGIKDLLARVKADKEEAKKRIEYYHDTAIGRFNQ